MRKRTWIASGLAAGLVATAGLVAASGSTAGAVTFGTPGPGIATSSGAVDFTTVLTNGVYSTTTGWTPAGGARQTIGTITTGTSGSNKCNWKSSATTEVLQPTATATLNGTTSTAIPSFDSKNNFGVYEGGANNTACGWIESNNSKAGQEALTIKVVPPASASGSRVTDVYLDLNLSSSALVWAQMYQGGTKVGDAGLQTGIAPPSTFVSPIPPTAQTLALCNATNSGAQSNNANNCRWHITSLVGPDGGYSGPVAQPTSWDAAWDTITLTVVYGSTSGGGGGTASIQGGQSWAGTGKGGPTVFNLVSQSQKSAQCNTADSVSSDSPLFDGSFRRFAFQRLTDYNPVGSCAPKGYTASLGTNGTSANLLASGDPYATWNFQLERDFATPGLTDPSPLKVDWSNGTGGTPTQIPYCSTANFTFGSAWSTFSATSASTNLFTYGADGPQSPTLNTASLPTDQYLSTSTLDYACIYGQSIEQLTEPVPGNPNATQSYTRVIDWVYVLGDIKVLY